MKFMKDTEITIQRMTPAGNVRGVFVLADFLFRDSASFTKEEISTLKTMVSNLNEHGFITVYELIEHKEIYVDPKHYPKSVKKIYHEDKRNEKITMDQFTEWVQREHSDFVNYYLNHWDYVFNGAFVWEDKECIECMFNALSQKPDFSVVHVETVVNYLDIYLNKEDAEGQLRAYDGYFTEKMEIQERKIFGSELQTLYKLLSLLNL
ncbi:hypothetical protein vBBak6_113 [Bacillus phage v_B-Bak6]|uniref:Uncharacterized protein n=2 Tax=Basiliskvirus TaxID=3044670 RepID=A0A385IK38_9CAUD|nr:hypothetical protein PP653_gp043 [Bacillus phage Basilisk]YP_010657013.1 hypothetical protein PP654_gp036 [Bacillus phage v_B-Bak10]AXY83073.1 hypothetical protein vBBak1_113 [Bacillus phage v_B-Bak1]AXY83193.1 hypothetical protein vBBak6_113 [Bacillus phage v_B-Bak6]AGR46659.1 hypothetical protein BASILISK_124 [Bacillus phage Basilisk]AXY83232.1 hypothetical protein vBBBak10_106 [Bacillus phage v_B-Bak10]